LIYGCFVAVNETLRFESTNAELVALKYQNDTRIVDIAEPFFYNEYSDYFKARSQSSANSLKTDTLDEYISKKKSNVVETELKNYPSMDGAQKPIYEHGKGTWRLWLEEHAGKSVEQYLFFVKQCRNTSIQFAMRCFKEIESFQFGKDHEQRLLSNVQVNTNTNTSTIVILICFIVLFFILMCNRMWNIG
jgi:hypothetical protein